MVREKLVGFLLTAGGVQVDGKFGKKDKLVFVEAVPFLG